MRRSSFWQSSRSLWHQSSRKCDSTSRKKHTIVSIAAGKTLASLKVLPLTPLSLAADAPAIFHSSDPQDDAQRWVRTLHTRRDIWAVVHVAGA